MKFQFFPEYKNDNLPSRLWISLCNFTVSFFSSSGNSNTQPAKSSKNSDKRQLNHEYAVHLSTPKKEECRTQFKDPTNTLEVLLANEVELLSHCEYFIRDHQRDVIVFERNCFEGNIKIIGSDYDDNQKFSYIKDVITTLQEIGVPNLLILILLSRFHQDDLWQTLDSPNRLQRHSFLLEDCKSPLKENAEVRKITISVITDQEDRIVVSYRRAGEMVTAQRLPNMKAISFSDTIQLRISPTTKNFYEIVCQQEPQSGGRETVRKAYNHLKSGNDVDDETARQNEETKKIKKDSKQTARQLF